MQFHRSNDTYKKECKGQPHVPHVPDRNDCVRQLSDTYPHLSHRCKALLPAQESKWKIPDLETSSLQNS